MALASRITTDTATGGVLQSDDTLKTLAQQNTQNPITQSTDTATSTPIPTGMIGSQGRQIVNVPTNATVTTKDVPDTVTTDPVTNTLGLPTPQYPKATEPVITPMDYRTGQPVEQPEKIPGAAVGASIGAAIAKPALSGTSGTNGTGGSGGSSGSSSSTSTTTTTTGSTGTTGTTPTTTQAPAWKEYFDKANSMEFVYDPATDNAYKLAASQIEQQVTDMMVGRGGLYSSVAQSALTSRLMELQVSYQQQAYEKYVADRAYYMDVAAFVADREDTEFDQALALDKFKADLEQQKFENSITSAELAIQRANAAYSRQSSSAKQEIEYSKGQLGILQVDYDNNIEKYAELVARWKRTNVADAEIAQYFGLSSTGGDYSSNIARINQVKALIDAQGNQLIAYAKQVQDAEAYANAIDAVKYGTDTTGYAATTSQIATSYNDNYTQVYNKVVSMHKDGNSWDSIKAYVSGANAASFRNTLGTINYNKLVAYLDRKRNEE